MSVNPDELFEDILAFEDEETGLRLDLVSIDPADENVASTLNAFFLDEGGEVVGTFRVTCDPATRTFDWTSVALASSFGNRGVLTRCASFVMPILKRYEIRRATVSPFSAAETIAKKHGYRRSPKNEGQMVIDPANWVEPDPDEKWEGSRLPGPKPEENE